jgi:hypothetical protein
VQAEQKIKTLEEIQEEMESIQQQIVESRVNPDFPVHRLEELNTLHGAKENIEQRLTGEPIKEIVIAVGTDVEGDATSFYLAKRLARDGLKITRIAHGLPAGTDSLNAMPAYLGMLLPTGFIGILLAAALAAEHPFPHRHGKPGLLADAGGEIAAAQDLRQVVGQVFGRQRRFVNETEIPNQSSG